MKIIYKKIQLKNCGGNEKKVLNFLNGISFFKNWF